MSDEKGHDDERVWQNLLCTILTEILRLNRDQVVGVRVGMVVFGQRSRDVGDDTEFLTG